MFLQFKEQYFKLKLEIQDLMYRNELLEIKLKNKEKSASRDRTINKIDNNQYMVIII